MTPSNTWGTDLRLTILRCHYMFKDTNIE